jgi:hypothetical protein
VLVSRSKQKRSSIVRFITLSVMTATDARPPLPLHPLLPLRPPHLARSARREHRLPRPMDQEPNSFPHQHVLYFEVIAITTKIMVPESEKH